MNLQELFYKYKEESIAGRYLTLPMIEPILVQLNTDNQLRIIGESVQGKPIYSYQIGNGKTKIFLWSQMHGNESTTTKALFDLINFLHSDDSLAKQFFRSIYILCNSNA